VKGEGTLYCYTYKKIVSLLLLVCVVAVTFPFSSASLNQDTACCEHGPNENRYVKNEMCRACDCTKKINVVRISGTPGGNNGFFLNGLFLQTALSWVTAPLWGLNTLIVLKTRMNN
jgi:hypothetical protein